MVQNFKRKWLYYVTRCMLAVAPMLFLPACATTSYQPQVPEHLRDHE